MAARLAHIASNTVTHGEYHTIGELYGFRLLVKTEESSKDGVQLRQARFFVEGGSKGTGAGVSVSGGESEDGSSRQVHPLVDAGSSRQPHHFVDGVGTSAGTDTGIHVGKGVSSGIGTRAGKNGSVANGGGAGNGGESGGVEDGKREVGIKYTFNNGVIAADPKLAVAYFLHALEKIPSLIERCEAEIEKLSRDLPVLREIVAATWRKEDDLRDLKTELSALDRKIQLSLTPVTDGNGEQDEAQHEAQHEKATAADERDRKSQATQTQADALSETRDNTARPHDDTGSASVSERLNEYKESMSDRLVVASVPKPDAEPRPKGIRM